MLFYGSWGLRSIGFGVVFLKPNSEARKPPQKKAKGKWLPQRIETLKTLGLFRVVWVLLCSLGAERTLTCTLTLGPNKPYSPKTLKPNKP